MSRQDSAYLRICNAIEYDIRAGKFRHGHRLPGEHWLAQHFGVSRMTIRQALSELARKQLITTRAGSGSYITFDNQHLEWTQGWSRAMTLHGARVEARVLHFGPLDDPELAARFQIKSRFIALDRLRLLDGTRAISLERSRIPLNAETEALLDIDFAHESLMDALSNRAGLFPASSEEWIEVARLRTEEAHLLERAIGEAFLLSRRVTRDQKGALIEHVSSLLDPSHFRLHINFDLNERQK
ncbi:GntR family transcriptional regulator [Ktedonosporobacter rubrisoli]|uniref:GntR family transcriptional regulator n=1 Tax=Ktedonosporobacter rubrisoli TaxID=2509675 RepID=A0A4V0YYV8_KTERU|nr:GntR family transcriptional regulator [Ktedonosporobacter rubrisoli]QBD77571.1 GntR family transcriptional regulator [Ktedonosporobacter rubrisoli]